MLRVLFCSLAVLGPRAGHIMYVLCPLSLWLTLPRGVLSTYWYCPSKHCSWHYLFLQATPLIVSSWCYQTYHSMLASLLWQRLTVPSLLQLWSTWLTRSALLQSGVSTRLVCINAYGASLQRRRVETPTTVTNAPAIDEAIPESLAAVGQQPVKETLESSIESDMLDVLSFPRLCRNLTHLLPYYVHHLQRPLVSVHWAVATVKRWGEGGPVSRGPDQDGFLSTGSLFLIRHAGTLPHVNHSFIHSVSQWRQSINQWINQSINR